MKLFSFIFVLVIACQSHADFTSIAVGPGDNFQSLSAQYAQSKMPTQKQLQESRWAFIGLAFDYSLQVNKDSEDKLNFDGVKNSDGSQMRLSFDSYNHPLFQLTLSKINFLQAGRDHLLIQVVPNPETQSIKFMYSAYPAGDKADIYYIQHCRVTAAKILICPATLMLNDAAAKKYENLPIAQANGKVTTIQVFSKTY